MKVLIFGASGIVGQHMRLCVPEGIEPVWYRREADALHHGYDLNMACDPSSLYKELSKHAPDVVINLAGESNVDVVEADPNRYNTLNAVIPSLIHSWCDFRGKKYVHVSTQAVFNGSCPPYSPKDRRQPVNHYGEQKVRAEDYIWCIGKNYGIIVRLSFVLGIRPMPHEGRQNPLEAMRDGQEKQVSDRWFSPLLAWDAAEFLWEAAKNAKPGDIWHCGLAEPWSRFDVALEAFPDQNFTPVSHSSFPTAAPRAKDTTYAKGSLVKRDVSELRRIMAEQQVDDRAIELALFFGITLDEAKEKLGRGFGQLHGEVKSDYLATFGSADVTDATLLDWYRKTEAYIWELSAYHDDPGFNYMGMCGGIAKRFEEVDRHERVLCLGDGIGDLTLKLCGCGVNAIYHDLGGSRTEAYARFRFWRQMGREMNQSLTEDFNPFHQNEEYSAIVSLDFLEHVPNVNEWVIAIYRALKPGGLFCAQNAFAIGSGPDGDMPMHLAVNDHFEQDWDGLLTEIGFVQEASQWYRKK